MKVYGVESKGTFTEYERLQFQADHDESDLEDWLEANPDSILEAEPLMIVGRQVRTDLGGFIDLLGLDRAGNVAVVELKRDRTPRDAVAQALEYAAFAARLDAEALEDLLRDHEGDAAPSLAERHRVHFALDETDVVAFNKDQRIVIVGQRVTREIRETASFLESKGILVACVEFAFFETAQGGRLLTQEVVVGREPPVPPTPTVVSPKEFLDSCDQYGREVFGRVLELARRRNMSINWGTKGFSAGVDVDGARVVVCYCYPPAAVYGQTLYTALRDRAGIHRKAGAPEEVVERLRRSANETGLFTAAGRELKAPIERSFTESEVESLLSWCGTVEDAILEQRRART